MTARFVSTALLLSLAALPVRAQESPLEDFAWLAGQWIGEDVGGGTVEVAWAPAIGSTMVGTRQMLEGDTLVAYETLKLAWDETGVTFIAQYSGTAPGTAGAALTTRMLLISHDGQRAVFEGGVFAPGQAGVLTMEVTVENELVVTAVDAGGEQVYTYRAREAPQE